jgi:hypothetical protein
MLTEALKCKKAQQSVYDLTPRVDIVTVYSEEEAIGLKILIEDLMREIKAYPVVQLQL